MQRRTIKIESHLNQFLEFFFVHTTQCTSYIVLYTQHCDMRDVQIEYIYSKDAK
jgi:hypothetical protein